MTVPLTAHVTSGPHRRNCKAAPVLIHVSHARKLRRREERNLPTVARSLSGRARVGSRDPLHPAVGKAGFALAPAVTSPAVLRGSHVHPIPGLRAVPAGTAHWGVISASSPDSPPDRVRPPALIGACGDLLAAAPREQGQVFSSPALLCASQPDSSLVPAHRGS